MIRQCSLRLYNGGSIGGISNRNPMALASNHCCPRNTRNMYRLPNLAVRRNYHHHRHTHTVITSPPRPLLSIPLTTRNKFTLVNSIVLRRLSGPATKLGKEGSSSGSSNGGKKKASQAWWYIARTLKIIRIPFLVGGVYYLGYNQGLLDYSRNPVEYEQSLLRQTLQECGCQDLSSQVSIIGEGEQKAHFAKLLTENTRCTGYGPGAIRSIQLGNVALVGERIVNSAKAFVAEEMHQYVKERARILSESNPNYDLESELEEDEGFIRRRKAMDRMGVQSGEKWRFVLLDVPMDNAFVSEFIPYTIFVTRGILNKIVSNNDELGLILGHEVSHMICGHSSEKNAIELKLKIAQTLLLTLDPTEGMLSIQINTLISFLKNLLTMSHSRRNEEEADALGIKIAAMACFDTKKASLVMEKLHQADSSDDTGFMNTIFKTHPPSHERYLYLQEASETENATKYEHCAHVKESFRNSWKLASS